jgi:hypothetical protein
MELDYMIVRDKITGIYSTVPITPKEETPEEKSNVQTAKPVLKLNKKE